MIYFLRKLLVFTLFIYRLCLLKYSLDVVDVFKSNLFLAKIFLVCALFKMYLEAVGLSERGYVFP